MLLTVFLRHDQSNNLDAVQTKLKDAGWWDRFPPDGVEIVSWTVAMGCEEIDRWIVDRKLNEASFQSRLYIRLKQLQHLQQSRMLDAGLRFRRGGAT